MALSKMIVQQILESKVVNIKFRLADAGFNDVEELISACAAVGGKFTTGMKVHKIMTKAGMDPSKKFQRWVRTDWGADVLVMDIEEPGEGDLAKGDS